jgi:hypothetical protein
MPPVVRAETRGDDRRGDHDTLQSLDESATKKDDDAKLQTKGNITARAASKGAGHEGRYHVRWH